MARTFSRASQNYAAGTYGPFSVDGLTKADTGRLKFTATVEGWPDVPLALELRMRWSTGDGADFTWAGNLFNRDGTPATSVTANVDVPMIAGPTGPTRMEVASGTATLIVHAAAGLRSAVALEAVAAETASAATPRK